MHLKLPLVSVLKMLECSSFITHCIMSLQDTVIMPCGDRCPTLAGIVYSAFNCSCTVFDPNWGWNLHMCTCPPAMVDICISEPNQESQNAISRSEI